MNEHLKNDAVVEVAGQWQSLDSFAIFSSATESLSISTKLLKSSLMTGVSLSPSFLKTVLVQREAEGLAKFRLMENLIDLLKETGLDSV